MEPFVHQPLPFHRVQGFQKLNVKFNLIVATKKKRKEKKTNQKTKLWMAHSFGANGANCSRAHICLLFVFCLTGKRPVGDYFFVGISDDLLHLETEKSGGPYITSGTCWINKNVNLWSDTFNWPHIVLWSLDPNQEVCPRIVDFLQQRKSMILSFFLNDLAWSLISVSPFPEVPSRISFSDHST